MMETYLVVLLAFVCGWWARDAHYYHTVQSKLQQVIRSMKAEGRDSITVKIEL